LVAPADAALPGTYRQRRVSSLQRLFRAHFPQFVARYEDEFAKRLGKFRLERITKEVERFLGCGDYSRGIARIQCTNPDCRLEYFRPFSCSVFHLCPSCSQKRTLLLGEYMNEQLLLRLPHKQFVFTLPKVLRVFFRKRFVSKVLPLFARRTKEIGDLLPELYLHGLAEGDFDLALRGLLGEKAPLSASTVGRLKEKWQAEYNGWKSRELKGLQVVYLWADGLYVKAGLEKEKAALLTVIAGLSDGRKEILHLESGYRESKESWAGVLRDLKKRGIEEVSLVVADGHLGIWAALPEVYPEAREQRCWNHKVINVLDRIPTKKQIEAKMMVAAIPYCATREEAEKGKSKFELWCKSNGLDKAAEILNADWERMMTFYSFPKEHWQHIRTTNVVESPLCCAAAANGRGEEVQESGERDGGDLEDDAGRRETVPKTECTRIVTGGISGRGILRWRCHRKKEGGCCLVLQRFIARSTSGSRPAATGSGGDEARTHVRRGGNISGSSRSVHWRCAGRCEDLAAVRKPILRVSAGPRLMVGRVDCVGLCAMGSAAEPSGHPPKGALAVGAIGDVVATRVVAQDCQCVLLVQPLSVEARNEQTLDLGQGQCWSFLYSGA